MKINDIIIDCIRQTTFNSDLNKFNIIANIESDIFHILNNSISDYKLELNQEIYTVNIESVYYVPCRKGLLQVILKIKEVK